MIEDVQVEDLPIDASFDQSSYVNEEEFVIKPQVKL